MKAAKRPVRETEIRARRRIPPVPGPSGGRRVGRPPCSCRPWLSRSYDQALPSASNEIVLPSAENSIAVNGRRAPSNVLPAALDSAAASAAWSKAGTRVPRAGSTRMNSDVPFAREFRYQNRSFGSQDGPDSGAEDEGADLSGHEFFGPGVIRGGQGAGSGRGSRTLAGEGGRGAGRKEGEQDDEDMRARTNEGFGHGRSPFGISQRRHFIRIRVRRGGGSRQRRAFEAI